MEEDAPLAEDAGAALVRLREEVARVRAELADERRARDQQARLFLAAQRAANLGYWHWSSLTGELTWSDELRRIVGFSPDSTPTVETFYSLVHEADLERVRAIDARILETGVPEQHEYRIRRPDGSIRNVRTSGTMLRSDQGVVEGFLGVTLDITEVRELEAKLQASQRLEAIGRLAGGVAHDFNNLLTIILGASHILSLESSDRPGTLAAVHSIEAACEQGGRLTRQLLTFARRQRNEPSMVDVGEVVTRAAPLLSMLLRGEAHLDVEVVGSHHFVRCDPGQLEQLVLNLVVNARDAVGTGGKVVLRVRPSDAPDPTRVLVEVEDDGPGIPEHVRDRIFEPFFTTKGDRGGTGLGLATCHGIAVSAGGTITFTTAPDGTTFRVELPLAQSLAERETVSAVTVAPAGRRILVVEDDAEVRALAVMSLGAAGFHVDEAGSVSEARRVLASRTMDLVLTDVLLADGLGADLAQEIWTREPSTAVVFASGARSEAETSVPDDPRASFLSKPYLLGELRTIVDEALTPARR